MLSGSNEPVLLRFPSEELRDGCRLRVLVGEVTYEIEDCRRCFFSTGLLIAVDGDEGDAEEGPSSSCNGLIVAEWRLLISSWRHGRKY